MRNSIYITAVTKRHNFFLSLSYLYLATSFILTCLKDLEYLKSAIGIFEYKGYELFQIESLKPFEQVKEDYINE